MDESRMKGPVEIIIKMIAGMSLYYSFHDFMCHCSNTLQAVLEHMSGVDGNSHEDVGFTAN